MYAHNISYIQLIYAPISSGFSSSRTISNCDPTEPAMPTVNFSCDRTVDSITGLLTIHLNWTYEYNPLIEEAISRRKIFLYAQTDKGDVVIGNNIPLDPQVT